MAVGTLAPSPVFTGFDNNGNPLSGGLLYTYAAGTPNTPLATYTDVGLTTPNANPVVLDSAGRCTLFLSPASYNFVLKTSAGATVWTQDTVGAVPATSLNLDVTATAGEALTAGQFAYLSDGSGGLTAGRWYLADADLAYASTDAGMTGAVVANLATGETGTVRLAGRLTGLSGLTIGAPYYLSATAGAITATRPALARFVGSADSLTSLVISGQPFYGVPGDSASVILAVQSFS
jgi:hypothetical protein